MKDPVYDTRRRLLVFMKKGGPLSTEDLARELKITGMAVRKHLSELEKDGLISANLERRPVGRPRYLYSLTDLAEGLFPTAYPQLAIDILDSIKELYGEDEVRRVLTLRAERLAERYGHQLREAPFAERVRQLALLREEAGLLVDLELRDGEYVFKEYNCSIYQVAKKHPAVCQCELELYRKLLDAEIVITSSLAKGDRHCQYIIKPRSTSPDSQALAD